MFSKIFKYIAGSIEVAGYIAIIFLSSALSNDYEIQTVQAGIYFGGFFLFSGSLPVYRLRFFQRHKWQE